MRSPDRTQFVRRVEPNLERPFPPIELAIVRSSRLTGGVRCLVLTAMLLYRTKDVALACVAESWHVVPTDSWDELLNSTDLPERLEAAIKGPKVPAPSPTDLLAPIGSQEVWAAGVTYFRSRTARMEESQVAGGGSFYDRVYHAPRPEIFFKATAQRVIGPGAAMHLRSDSRWIVPEPELTLALNCRGERIGYTIGNDLSCRDIEGENPLYLPQAKCFTRCAAIGPAIWMNIESPPAETKILCQVFRDGALIFQGETVLDQLKRSPDELAEFLFRDNTFPEGVFLMTGTGIVPPDDFTLIPNDSVHITIEPIGTLINSMD